MSHKNLFLLINCSLHSSNYALGVVILNIYNLENNDNITKMSIENTNLEPFVGNIFVNNSKMVKMCQILNKVRKYIGGFQ